MGTVPTFPRFTPGEKPPAAKLNQMADWADFTANVPKCYAYQGSTQSLTSGAYPAITLDGTVYDVRQAGDTAAHDNVTNNTRIYIRTAGKYWVSAQAQIGANATGTRAAQVRVNAAGSSAGGSLVITNQQAPLSGISTSVTMVSPPVPFAVGDYLELFATQNSGSTLSTVTGQGVCFLSVTWAGA